MPRCKQVCYAHAVQDRFNEQPRVHYTILVKTKTPQIQHLETVRNDKDISRLGNVVQAVDLAIESKAFYPVESPMNCSGCAFYRPCKEWQGGPRTTFVCFEKCEKEELVQC
jgi:putative RecB family exonuclease